MSHLQKPVQLTNKFTSCACGCRRPIIGRYDRMTASNACRKRVSRAHAAAAAEAAALAKTKRRRTSKRPKSKR